MTPTSTADASVSPSRRKVQDAALPPTKAPLEAPAEAVYDFRAANAGGCCAVM